MYRWAGGTIRFGHPKYPIGIICTRSRQAPVTATARPAPHQNVTGWAMKDTRAFDILRTFTPSPPTKSFPTKSPRVELSGRLPIKFNGHENSTL